MDAVDEADLIAAPQATEQTQRDLILMLLTIGYFFIGFREQILPIRTMANAVANGAAPGPNWPLFRFAGRRGPTRSWGRNDPHRCAFEQYCDASFPNVPRLEQHYWQVHVIAA